ncbi:MAG: patatin-like phospholipase family protein [Gemmataceae bacterium]
MPDPAPESLSPVVEPVVRATGVERAPAAPEAGVALCLSGGGYRASVFHLGALLRLKQLGLLGKLRRVSSVSGGSITAAALGQNWGRLDLDSTDTDDLIEHVVDPVRKLCGLTIDAFAIGWGTFNPFSTISEQVAGYYRQYLFGDATLQDLPADPPRFVINATNVMTGSLWRFSRPYMGDYQVGLIDSPTTSLATAVAASSAFPPFLSPLPLALSPGDFKASTLGEFGAEPYTRKAVLTDGGVYDNLGLETAWKRFDTVLVSDGGRKMSPDPAPSDDWARHSRRLLDLLQHQTSNLRRRQVIESFERFQRDGEASLARDGRKGAYWGVQTNIASYGLADALDCPHDVTTELANIDTRLAALDEAQQERLINWGYAVCDAAVRKHFPQAGAPARKFPYDRGV